MGFYFIMIILWIFLDKLYFKHTFSIIIIICQYIQYTTILLSISIVLKTYINKRFSNTKNILDIFIIYFLTIYLVGNSKLLIILISILQSKNGAVRYNMWV